MIRPEIAEPAGPQRPRRHPERQRLRLPVPRQRWRRAADDDGRRLRLVQPRARRLRAGPARQEHPADGAPRPARCPGKAALGGQNGIRENSPGQPLLRSPAGARLGGGPDGRADRADPGRVEGPERAQGPGDGRGRQLLRPPQPGADNRGDNTKTGTTAEPLWPNELPQSYDPESTTQDFIIALSDTEGHEAHGPRRATSGGATPCTCRRAPTPPTRTSCSTRSGSRSASSPAQGVDISSLDRLELRFGEDGTPASGSIQLADVRFQEAAADEPLVLSDGTALDQGAGYGAPATGPDPADVARVVRQHRRAT